jgi:hypothetical protein
MIATRADFIHENFASSSARSLAEPDTLHFINLPLLCVTTTENSPDVRGLRPSGTRSSREREEKTFSLCHGCSFVSRTTLSVDFAALSALAEGMGRA